MNPDRGRLSFHSLRRENRLPIALAGRQTNIQISCTESEHALQLKQNAFDAHQIGNVWDMNQMCRADLPTGPH